MTFFAIRVRLATVCIVLVVGGALLTGCRSSDAVSDPQHTPETNPTLSPTKSDYPPTVVVPTKSLNESEATFPYKTYSDVAHMYSINVEYFQFEGSYKTKFRATIIGGLDTNQRMHCGGVDWRFGNGHGMSISGDCLSFEEFPNFQRTHSVDYEFTEAGDYELIFRYGDIFSNPVFIHIDETDAIYPILSPEEAVEQRNGTHVDVRGMCYAKKDDVPGLCGFVFDSLPPTCDPSLKVENYSINRMPILETMNGISWLAGSITLSETLSDGVLSVDD